MHCSHCGLCCEKTQMMLTSADVKRLERAGYDRNKFTYQDKNGYLKLKNHRGFCIFYDIEKRRCKTYRHRPSGCRIYPIIYSELEGIVVDDLCPMKNTISESELKTKGKKVMKLIQRIDSEAISHRNTTKKDKAC
jgi:Fe-S-cluster containining protein